MSKTAREVALAHLAALPPEVAVKSDLLYALLFLEECTPAIAMAGAALVGRIAAAEGRDAVRHAREEADAAACSAHQAEMNAIDLAERKLRLVEAEERAEASRRARAAETKRGRANGDHA